MVHRTWIKMCGITRPEDARACVEAGVDALGFVFAYTMVRCNIPGKRLVHMLALVPTVSPPFAIALATILLFGRNGLVTRKLLGMTFTANSWDIYGMDGLVFVQTITFFSVAYLIVRAMLERLDPSMEEAAHSLGLSTYFTYRDVILPQAVRRILPPLAGQFISTIKDSAIVAVISIRELTFQGLELMSTTYRTFEIWITITALYLVMTLTFSVGVSKLEAYMARSQ